jgi:hypothetical protein
MARLKQLLVLLNTFKVSGASATINPGRAVSFFGAGVPFNSNSK